VIYNPIGDDELMKIIIAYGSLGKYFHLQEFSNELEKLNVNVKLVHDSDFSKGFPSRNISDWFYGNKEFQKLIKEYKPDAIFTDRQSHFALHSINSNIPTFVLLRGHYWQENYWAMKTMGTNLRKRILIWLRHIISEKVFANATAILPICKYLEDVVKEHHPNQNTGVFFEGVNSSRWHHTEKLELKHPAIGLLQDANWWGKTKELLVLEEVLRKMPDVYFYWAGDGQYRKEITDKLEKYDNFKWLGRIEYPDGVRKFLDTIDIYALITGMDLAPLTLKEAQLMEKPVIATDVGGDKEMMIDCKTGYLVKEGDSDDIVEKLTKILNDGQLATELGKAGSRFIKNEFNWERVAKNFLNVIQPYIKKE
jgi:glycosyltransferase involved in cell wall biosynthesis